MVDKLAIKLRWQASYVVFVQLVVTLIIALIFVFATRDWRASYSALLGGMVCLVPHWIFIRTYFSKSGACAAKQIVQLMYKAELYKWLLSYVVTYLSIWLAPWIIRKV